MIAQGYFCKFGQGHPQKKILPVNHSSLISFKTAETSRRQEVWLGKIETTRARRRTSRCNRSTPLVVRINLPAYFPMQSFHAVGGADQFAMCYWKGKDHQSFRNIVCHPFCQARSRFLVLLHRFGQVSICCGPIWCLEDGANIFCDFGLHLLAWHVGLSVLLQMKLTSLPGNASKNSQASCFQACVIIANDQLHSTQPSCSQPLQKRAPVNFVLTQRDRNAQNIPFSSQIDAPDTSRDTRPAVVRATSPVHCPEAQQRC